MMFYNKSQFCFTPKLNSIFGEQNSKTEFHLAGVKHFTLPPPTPPPTELLFGAKSNTAKQSRAKYHLVSVRDAGSHVGTRGAWTCTMQFQV